MASAGGGGGEGKGAPAAAGAGAGAAGALTPYDRKITIASRLRPINESEQKAGATIAVAMEREGEGELKTGTRTGLVLRIATPGGPVSADSGVTFWSATGSRRSAEGLLEADTANRPAHEYASQEAVYNDLFAPLVSDALDNGMPCCFIALGTGLSGKNFTVIGKKPNRGILPFALRTIVTRLEQTKTRQSEFIKKHRVYLSMYQICHDKIYDMQASDGEGSAAGPPGSTRGPSELKEHSLFFEGLVFTRILTESDGLVALDTAAKKAIAARGELIPFTHTIYTLTIDSTTETATPPVLNTAHIHFVVAGDSDKAVASTEFPEEAKTLARSLSALRAVLSAHKNPSPDFVPPYGDSCLIRILTGFFQDRRWRTVVLGALSPASTAVQPTLDTLKYLSLVPETAPPTPTADSAAAAELAKQKLAMGKRRAPSSASDPDVLLVEDVPVSKRVAQVSMQRASYKVEVASDGESAVEAFKQNWQTLKIVLMDIGLPKMSGVEAAAAIRAFEETKRGKPTVYILGLTSTMEEENLEDYKRAGMNGCIMKGNLVADAVAEALKKLGADPRKFVTLTIPATPGSSPSGALSPPSRERGEKKGKKGSPRTPKRNLATLAARAQTSEGSAASVDIPDDKALGGSGSKNAGPASEPKRGSASSAAEQKVAAAAAATAATAAPPVPKVPSAASVMMWRRDPSARGSVRPGIGLPSARSVASAETAAPTATASTATAPTVADKPAPKAAAKSAGSAPSSASSSSPSSSSSSSSSGAAAAPTGPAPPPEPLDVLLVEDIRVSLKAAQNTLTRLGYRVDVASTGEEAVTKFRNNTFAVVLMDIGLPGISGIEASQQIRAIERERGVSGAGVHLFGLTGNAEEENLTSYAEVGMNGCILKGTTLGDALRTALKQRAQDPRVFVKLSKTELDQALAAEAAAGAAPPPAEEGKKRGKQAAKKKV